MLRYNIVPAKLVKSMLLGKFFVKCGCLFVFRKLRVDQQSKPFPT